MFFTKKQQKLSYDRQRQVPVIRSSICTGEKTAGFKDINTGKFEEVSCIHSEKELQDFMELYGILPEELKTEY